MEWSTLVKDIAVGLGTGLVASYSYEHFVSRRRAAKLRQQFGVLEGQYQEFKRLPETGLSLTKGIITLRYLGDKRFATSGTNAAENEHWRGEIAFDSPSGLLGDGYYSYDDRDDVGIHRVIYNSTLLQFDVSGENTSHPYGVKDFKMAWKRKSA
jgi:hypothetical protein